MDQLSLPGRIKPGTRCRIIRQGDFVRPLGFVLVGRACVVREFLPKGSLLNVHSEIYRTIVGAYSCEVQGISGLCALECGFIIPDEDPDAELEHETTEVLQAG